MAAIRHPNVAMLMGLCLSPICVVTEFCARGSLTDVLRKAASDTVFAQQLVWRKRITMALDAAKVKLLTSSWWLQQGPTSRFQLVSLTHVPHLRTDICPTYPTANASRHVCHTHLHKRLLMRLRCLCCHLYLLCVGHSMRVQPFILSAACTASGRRRHCRCEHAGHATASQPP